MVKKGLFIVLVSFVCCAANAADVIFYKNKEAGKTVFEVFNSRQIALMRYVQKNNVLRIYLNMGEDGYSEDFEVQSPQEAMKIIERISNDNDKSLIELQVK